MSGLPKAARIGHMKAIGSMALFDVCGATSDDIIYITLPLYHISASLLGIGGCIHLGKMSAFTSPSLSGNAARRDNQSKRLPYWLQLERTKEKTCCHFWTIIWAVN